MNIYIKPENEELLRRYDGSMSGLVNRLLEQFFNNNPSAATGVRREVDKIFDPPAPQKEGRVTKKTSKKPEFKHFLKKK